MAPSLLALFLSFYILDFPERSVRGHGRLMEPPSRGSLWRFPEFAKYGAKENWNDNELFCGGFKVQYKHNAGRCGPCGDPYNATVPREHEIGGHYDTGLIVRDYKVGGLMDVAVQLTKSHKGYFQFRLCNHKDPNLPDTQACFNKNVLELADGSGTKYPIQSEQVHSEYFRTSLRLPKGLACPHCVLQWHYRTGNSWGNCTDGRQALGCGNQEIFRGCSDIAIY